jgi:hypothetical protein
VLVLAGAGVAAGGVLSFEVMEAAGVLELELLEDPRESFL